ncbi:hypothetical protein [Ascidiimonas sp. W6]|uniref:hypothetical protein n=1 Tax=Ascidiimonas meishanensis TaxID=3128903 RepID=UPI0030EC049E
MTKIFKANNLYYAKIALLIFMVILGYLLYDFIIISILGGIQSVWARVLMFVLLGVFLVIALFVVYIVITSNKPVIELQEDFVRYKYRKIFFKDIKHFYVSKGGSEPFIITKDNNQIDMELSWLRKKERLEIEDTIQKKISS